MNEYRQRMMRKISIYNNRLVKLIWTIMCIFCFTTCLEDNITNIAVESNIMVGIKAPASLNGLDHEDLIITLDVLVFEKDGNFIEQISAVEEDDVNLIYSFKIKQGIYDFIFLANCTDIITECYPSGILKGTSRNDVINKLELSWPDKWVLDETDPDYKAMPMWGNKYSVAVGSNGADLTGQEDLVPMIRMMARIDVLMGAPYSEGKRLHSVRIYNRRPKGQVIPTEGNYTFTYSGDWDFSILYPSIPSLNNDKVKEPLYYDIPKEYGNGYEAKIYTFETEAKDAIIHDDNLEYTCLVLGIGTKDNDGGGATRANDLGTLYYRVDFINNNTGEFVGVLRNHHYVVTVDEIINEGFPDPDLAYRSQQYGFNYTVQAWENYNDEVKIPGDYRLDISTTFLDITTNEKDHSIQITSTHPDGFSAYRSDYPDRIDITNDESNWIDMMWVVDDQFYMAHDNNKYILDLPPNKTLNLELYINRPSVSIPGDTRSAYIHIVSGNLTNVIKIRNVGTTST